MKSGGEALPAAEVRVKSGVLEGSNVSAIEAMTEIIQSSRQYEMQVKMMKSADELATKSSALLRMN
jgi:flagellar basal-body rod protein FlgF